MPGKWQTAVDNARRRQQSPPPGADGGPSTRSRPGRTVPPTGPQSPAEVTQRVDDAEAVVASVAGNRKGRAMTTTESASSSARSVVLADLLLALAEVDSDGVVVDVEVVLTSVERATGVEGDGRDSPRRVATGKLRRWGWHGWLRWRPDLGPAVAEVKDSEAIVADRYVVRPARVRQTRPRQTPRTKAKQ